MGENFKREFQLFMLTGSGTFNSHSSRTGKWSGYGMSSCHHHNHFSSPPQRCLEKVLAIGWSVWVFVGWV